MAVAAVVLVGCTGLSVDTPVEAGLELGERVQPPVRVVYPGPGIDADQESIVTGFLRAGGASDGAYDVARSFLTTRAGTKWAPDSAVVVLAPGARIRVTPVDADTVVVTAPTSGQISATGDYVSAAPGSEARALIDLTNEDGQWRVSTLPEGFGRWLPEAELPRLIQPFAVYFVAEDRRTLVPDLRWFPLDRLASRLARAQLDPVPKHLLGTVTSAVPAGTRLAGDTVVIDDGVASVNLVVTSPPDDPELRADLVAQLVATVRQDSRVSGVKLLSNGVPVALPGAPEVTKHPSDVGLNLFVPGPAAYPVVRRGTQVRIYRSTDDESSPDAALSVSYPAVPANQRALALSADGRELASLDGPGVIARRWREGREIVLPPFASSMCGPRYDRRGIVWFGGVSAADKRTRLFVQATSQVLSAAPAPVDVPWLVGRQVTELSISPNGDLLAVISTDSAGRGARVDVTGIRRDANGLPQAVGGRLRLGPALTAVRGLTWVSETALATIADGNGSTRVPTILELSGTVRSLPPLADAVRIDATSGGRALIVGTSKGTFWLRSGAQWNSGGTGQLISAAG